MNKNSQHIAQWLGKASKPVSAPVLGKREIEIMEMFWSVGKNPLTATNVSELLNQNSEDENDSITLNTVQSTLERLYRKSLLSRTKQGRAFMYHALQSKHTVISQLIAEISDEMSDDDPNVMLSGFIEFLETRHPKWNMPRVLVEGMGKITRRSMSR